MLTDICDGGGTVDVDPDRPSIRIPEGYEKKTDARLVAPITLALEHEVNIRRLEAARQFARLNGLNWYHGSGKLGILTAWQIILRSRAGFARFGCFAESIPHR